MPHMCLMPLHECVISLQCYESVAEVANHWLDVIDSRGEDLADDELMEVMIYIYTYMYIY